MTYLNEIAFADAIYRNDIPVGACPCLAIRNWLYLLVIGRSPGRSSRSQDFFWERNYLSKLEL